jgi:hypothetical protein
MAIKRETKVAKAAPVKKKSSLIQRGEVAEQRIRKLEQERILERQKIEAQGGYINKFYFPKLDGEKITKSTKLTKTFIILDADPKELPSVNVHDWWDASERKFYSEVCVAQLNKNKCPVCDYLVRKGEKYPKPSYNTYVTIFDLSTYEKDGKKLIAGKKLLQIKPSQREAFMTVFEAAFKKHKTIKGLKLALKKDYGKTQSPSIGELTPIDGQSLWSMLKMSVIEGKYGDKEEILKGKVVKQKNSNLKAYDYEKVFADPDVEELAKKYGQDEEDFSTEDEEESINDYLEDTDETEDDLEAEAEDDSTETEETEEAEEAEEEEVLEEDEEESDEDSLADELDELSNEDDE